MLSMTKLSPMMKQYFEIKEEHKDTILFFRLGDFYEMFFEDAKIASKELELTLTGRDCGQEERAPMCGVPYHSSESYIARLVSKGYKVAICEQVEDPNEAKGIVKRSVVRIITPGTVLENTMLDETCNNFICNIYLERNTYCNESTRYVWKLSSSWNNITSWNTSNNKYCGCYIINASNRNAITIF